MTKKTKTTPEPSITSLHQAFDGYRAFIELGTGVKTTVFNKQRLYVVARLREEHPDEPLSDMNLDRCAQLIDRWRNRPFGRNGNRLSMSTSSKLLKELVRFLKWLDVSPASSWRLPRGFECLNRRVIDLPSDRMQLRKNRVKPNGKGLYTRHIGGRRFLFGRCEVEATRREETVRRLWQLLRATNGEDCWTAFALNLAKGIASGRITMTFDDTTKGGAA